MKETENNFQIKSMVYKMKKIKKSKKKDPLNIQNIQPLEVLENFQSNQDIENENTKNQKEGFDNNNGYGLPDDNFDGGDEVNSQNGDVSIVTKSLTDFINQFYIYLILVNCCIAFSITNGVGSYNPKSSSTSFKFVKKITYIDTKGNNDNPFNGGDENLDKNLIKDSNVIYQYICAFEAVISAYLFTLIWFNNIFYKYYVNKPYLNIFDYLSRDSIKQNTTKFSGLILFFFGYAFAILEDIRWFFEKFIPRISLKYLNKPFLYILLFILIFNFNHRFLSEFKNLLINMIISNYASLTILILSCIIIFEYVSSFKDSESEFRSYIRVLSNSYLQLFFDFLKEIIRLIIIIIFAVPFGVTLCILYFFFVCFFSIFDSFNELSNIVDFIRSDVMDLLNPDPCNVPKTLWDYIKNSFLYLSIFIYNNLIFIITIIYCMYILCSNINLNGSLTAYLQGFHIPFLLMSIIMLFMLLVKYKRADNDVSIGNLFFNPDRREFENYLRFTSKFIAFFVGIGIAITFILVLAFSVQ